MRTKIVSDSFMLAQEMLLRKHNIRLPFTMVELKTPTIGQGLMSIELDCIFSGTMPEQVVVGLVANSRLNGHPNENPFLFQHFWPTFNSHNWVRTFDTKISTSNARGNSCSDLFLSSKNCRNRSISQHYSRIKSWPLQRLEWRQMNCNRLWSAYSVCPLLVNEKLNF